MKALKGTVIACSILIVCVLTASIYMTSLYRPKQIEAITYNYDVPDDDEDDFDHDGVKF